MTTCRICLDTERSEDMIAPCQCRGTARYIHRRCLEQYIDHYPDGICRVCLTPFVYSSPKRVWSMVATGLMLLAMLFSSSAPIVFKIIYFGIVFAVLFLYMVRNLFTPIVALIVAIVYTTLGHGTNASVNLWTIMGLTGMCMMYTMFRYIPQPYILIMLTIIVLTLYAVALLIFVLQALGHNDPTFTALFTSLLFLLWCGILHIRPPMRLALE
jgi:hypothetical protein